MSKAEIHIEGFIANELTPRTAGTHTVVDVSVPHTPQKRDESGNWVDAGETTWYRASFWDEHGNAILGAAEKGTLVTLSGGLKASTYEKRDGSAGVQLEVVFPALAVVARRPARGAGGQQSRQNAPAGEPWAAGAPNAAQGDWAAQGGYSDEAPF
jgi:single-strand DNA-binding protein